MSLWQPHEDELLKSLFAKGLTYSVIAGHMTRMLGQKYTRNKVLGRGNRLGLKVKTHPQKRDVSQKVYLGVIYFSNDERQCRYFHGDGRDKTQCKGRIWRGSYCQEHYLACHEVGASGKEPPP